MQKLISLFLIIIFFHLKVNAQENDSLKVERFSIHAQATVINQYKPAFTAPYTGNNSLSPDKESKTSITSTLYLGTRLWKGATVFINPEIAGGSGLSDAQGIAAATNGETFRIGDAAPKIYLARLFYRQLFSLSTNTTFQESDNNQIAQNIPIKYFSFTIGKIGVADYFDNNKYSHDPRTQFMSWALMDNGAWDYPANTRGYTPSIVLEYMTPKNEIRYGISLVPKEANGLEMNWDLSKAYSNTLEYTHHYSLRNKEGAFRLLAYFTSTDMGNYKKSIAVDSHQPVIEITRAYGNTKYGFAINFEQQLNNSLGCFLRAGWNDGNNETWAFTEIDQTASLGILLNGEKWKRKNDHIGLAYVVSGISKPHRDYLKAGGEGFMLGDGNLNYALENLTELYYSAELSKDKIYLTGVYQLLINPGYNADRKGPVNIFSVRVHLVI